MLIPDAGPCKGSHLRYYYDRAAMSCQKFLYGGCHGNGNNFETLDACSSQCGVKSLFNEPVLHACPLHGCTPYRLKCGRGLGLKKDENGCTLCECATGVVATAEENVPCPFHSCTAEMLGCEYGLTVNDNGCEFCTCAPSPAVPAIPCPLHSCSLENMQCEFGLATNENGCELCECAIPPEVPNGTEAPAAVACPAHACSAENMGCTGGLATNENGCELCECAVAAPVMCPLHSCTAEAMGCLNGLATDERGCDMCECAETVAEPVEKALELTPCQQQRENALSVQGQVQDGPFVPTCLEDGSYSLQQCYWYDCWCVAPQDGKEIEGTRVSASQRNSMTCGENSPDKPISPPKSIHEQPGPAPKRSKEEVARREVEKALGDILTE
uniref:BPTI/Kunitz inhibitor domain-containing protein n=1 Tax=Ciona savignyi TaxID=51511 RepID=H2YTV1_CIOSA